MDLLICIIFFIIRYFAGEKIRLTLVEVFIPPQPSAKRNSVPDPNVPVLTTVSPCSSVTADSSQLLQYFITATKIWQLVNTSGGDRLKKEFFLILSSMSSLSFDKWAVFQEFEFDFLTYTGKHGGNASHILPSLKLASMYCGMGNFQVR